MGFWDFLRKRERYDSDYFEEYYRNSNNRTADDAYAKPKESFRQDKEKVEPKVEPRKSDEVIFKDEGEAITTPKPEVKVDKPEGKNIVQPSPAISPAISSGYYEGQRKTGEPLRPRERTAEGKDVKPFVYKPIYKEKKDVVIIVIENTVEIAEHKDTILQIIKRLVDTNKTSFFLFARSGKSGSFFDMMDLKAFEEQKIIEQLFPVDKETEDVVERKDVLECICAFLRSQRSVLDDMEYKDKKYELKNAKLVFIGAAVCEEEQESISKSIKLINEIKLEKKVKIIKYFCMEDKQTINAAALGFPVIGHIISDFYK